MTELYGKTGVVKVRAMTAVEQMMVLPRDLPAADRDRVLQMLAVLKTRGTDFDLTTYMERKNLWVVVLIKEENFGKPTEESLVGNAIAAKLVEAGYQVLADHEIGKSNLQRLNAAIKQDQFWPLGREIHQIAQLAVVGTCATRPGSGTAGAKMELWVTHQTGGRG